MTTKTQLYTDKKNNTGNTVPAILLLLLCFLNTTAQIQMHWCGSDKMRQKNFNDNPQTKYRNDSIENALLLSVTQNNQTKRAGGDGTLPTPQQIYTIPVVVHIIHNNGVENISDAEVVAGIQYLNDAFRNVGIFDPNTGVDTEIEFCLAVQDENGNFTTGINRVVSTYTNMIMETEDLNVKNLIRWDPTKYLNFWLVNSITSQAMGPSVAGYAYFPSSHGNPEDGIVNEAHYFGFSPHNAKVAVHEVGHYLGLNHTFEGGCSNNNCLTDGDKVCDTPPDASTAPVSCVGTVNTCQTDDDDLSANNPFRPSVSGGQGDQDDMFINYMDYGDQSCQSAFTFGQKNRMVSFLTGTRASLLESHGCWSICTSPVTASFTASAAAITAGGSVTFTNTSSGATGYTWQINGTVFSTAINSNYTFNTQGTYSINLIADNGDPSCTKDSALTVTVTCPVTASFTSSATQIIPGDNVIFTNTSTGATSYEWFIDGVSQGTTAGFNHTFSSNGGFTVSLVASGGICSETFYQYIAVGMCRSKEANFWYFGTYQGLDFSSGSPVVISGSLDSNEGCASISDKTTGQLLFYTNGDTVWNSTHMPMPNGFGLLGHSTTTQSATIVPKPGSSTLYYIFTLWWQAWGGLTYSVVDMSLNGGLGDITIKNVPLITPTTEKCVAVRHCNETDIWVITHEWNTNAFYTYLVSSTGVSAPVVSNIGIVEGGNSGQGFEALGYLKASPNGKKLVAAHTYIANAPTELFDFDNSTGIISNVVNIPVDTVYGASFSPDNSKLYINVRTITDGLKQYDLNAPDIVASGITIHSDGSHALQLAPNGKIYGISGNCQDINVINNPNATGLACDYVTNVLDLTQNYCNSGLPNFIDGYLYEPAIKGPDGVCLNTQNVVYSIDGCSGNVSWLLHGQSTIMSVTDSNVVVNFNGSGTDTLIAEITRTCGVAQDTLFITVTPPPVLELGADTVICQGSSIILNAGIGHTSYLWQDGSVNQTYTVNTAGQYKVTVADNGCAATDSILVNPAQTVTLLDLGPDIYTCNGAIAVLDAGSGFSSYQWQDGAENNTYSVYLPGSYWVTVSSCGTITSDTVNVFWQNNVPFSITQQGSLCEGQSIVLTVAPANLASYIWDDGSNNISREVQSPGMYSLIATAANGCYGQDSVEVIETNCNCILTVPTAFSPNNDGHNDAFILHGFEGCVSDFSLQIFDRWGEKVFETENVSVSWNGNFKSKPLNPGVFVYYITATLITGEKIDKKGNISLIR